MTSIYNQVNNILTDSNFNNKILILNNKDNINSFLLFFEDIKKNININFEINKKKVKYILSLYTIIYYPEIFNLKPEMEINKQITNISNILNILIKNIVNNFINNQDNKNLQDNKNFYLIKFFFKKIDEYLIIFDKWSSLDKEAIFFNLAVCIFDLEIDYNKIYNDKENKI